MQFSALTLQHLQDEAYAFLCREALQQQLEGLAREKSAIEDTRPPFGMLARKSTREAFSRSMQTVLENETAVRDQLARLDAIIDWVRPLIRNSVSGYLAAATPSYCALLQLQARIDDWERAAGGLPELLQAFNRDLRGLRFAASRPGATSVGCRRELAILREIAERLERHGKELDLIAQAISANAAAADPAYVVAMPRLPELRRLAWVGRLALLPISELVLDVTRVETQMREGAASLPSEIPARLQNIRDHFSNLDEDVLEQYWDQLRVHARQHYVEERDVSEVLEMLTERYVDAELKRRQDTLADPFMGR